MIVLHTMYSSTSTWYLKLGFPLPAFFTFASSSVTLLHFFFSWLMTRGVLFKARALILLVAKHLFDGSKLCLNEELCRFYGINIGALWFVRKFRTTIPHSNVNCLVHRICNFASIMSIFLSSSTIKRMKGTSSQLITSPCPMVLPQQSRPAVEAGQQKIWNLVGSSAVALSTEVGKNKSTDLLVNVATSDTITEDISVCCFCCYPRLRNPFYTVNDSIRQPVVTTLTLLFSRSRTRFPTTRQIDASFSHLCLFWNWMRTQVLTDALHMIRTIDPDKSSNLPWCRTPSCFAPTKNDRVAPKKLTNKYFKPLGNRMARYLRWSGSGLMNSGSSAMTTVFEEQVFLADRQGGGGWQNSAGLTLFYQETTQHIGGSSSAALYRMPKVHRLERTLFCTQVLPFGGEKYVVWIIQVNLLL